MFSKSALVALCFAFFLTSLTLLFSPSRLADSPAGLNPPEFNPASAVKPASELAIASVAPAALASHVTASAMAPVFRQTPTAWGLWSQALQRTRQLLWMATRQDRLLRTAVELV